jgi:hypothetical protein
VSSLEGTNPKKKKIVFLGRVIFLLWEAVLYRSIQYVQSVQSYGFGMKIEVVLGTIFEANFYILFVVFGPYGTVCTTNYWHENRGTEQAV